MTPGIESGTVTFQKRHGDFPEGRPRGGAEVDGRFRVGLVHLGEDVVDRVDHERQVVIDHTEEEGPLAQGDAQHREELGRGEGAHQGVDPHRHDEQDDGDRALVVLLVREDPGGGIAQQNAQARVLERHLDGDGECRERIPVRKELRNVLQREPALTVLEGVDHHQHQR